MTSDEHYSAQLILFSVVVSTFSVWTFRSTCFTGRTAEICFELVKFWN